MMMTRYRWLVGWLVFALLWLGSAVGCEEKTCPVCPEPVVCDGGPGKTEPPGAEPQPEPAAERPQEPRGEPPQERPSGPDGGGPEPRPGEPSPPDAPAAPTSCGPPTGTFYEAPATLPRVPGRLLKCESLGTQSAAVIGGDPRYAGSGGAAAHGVALFRMMYVTEAPKGQFHAVTALLHLPQSGASACVAGAPIALVAHGTTGMAPHCGPSRFPDFGLRHLTWPLSGRGAVVVAPDLIGLGANASGGHPYLVTEPTQQAMVDAVKATAAVGAMSAYKGCVGRRVLLMGHSQGGHAALVSALALASALPGYQHVGTVAFAPAFGDERVWLGPFQASLRSGVATAYFLAYLIAVARYRGGNDLALSQWLTPKAASLLPGWLDSFCFGEWTTLLLHNFPTFGDIFQPSFLTASQACNGGSGNCQSFAAWVAAIRGSVVQARADLGPTLLVQGGADTVVSAGSVGCIFKRYQSAGAKIAACSLASANHSTVISGAWAGILPWIQAALQGKTPPAPGCASSTLPACP